MWCSLDVAPVSFFEQVIHSLYPLAQPGPECVGAEYWARIQPANTGFAFHFDRDEAVRSEVVSPQLSSILYLSEVGGPTLITGARPKSREMSEQVVGVFPKPARFALFPGDLLHGVQPGEPSRWPRVAFFINWWASRPQACTLPSSEFHQESPAVPTRLKARPKRIAREDVKRVPSSDVLDSEGWRYLIDSALR